MRRSPVWIVPWAIAAVDQLIARRVPALQFYQRIQPTAQVPTSDARPHVANLLLSCTPNFLDVVKLLFDTPAVRDDLQDRFHTHRRVGADVRRPVTAGMFKQHHAHRATDDMAGCQKGLVATFGHHAAAPIADRLPAVTASGPPAQADSVLAVLARPTTLPNLVHRKIEQLGITTKPRDDRRPFGQQGTHQCLGCIRTIEHHDEAGLTAECSERSHYLPGKVQGELMFRAEFPVIAFFECFDVNFANVQPREQRQGNPTKDWMAQHHRQADPVVPVEPISVARTRCGVVVNVGRFDAGAKSFGRRIVDRQCPETVFAVSVLSVRVGCSRLSDVGYQRMSRSPSPVRWAYSRCSHRSLIARTSRPALPLTHEWLRSPISRCNSTRVIPTRRIS